MLSISDYVTTGDVTWDEKQLKPLIEQATILESGEKTQIINPNQSSISSQGEVGSEQPALDTPPWERCERVKRRGSSAVL